MVRFRFLCLQCAIFCVVLYLVASYIKTNNSRGSRQLYQYERYPERLYNLRYLLAYQNSHDNYEEAPTEKTSFKEKNSLRHKTDILNKVKDLTKCLDKPVIYKQRLNYWVLYNYVVAERTFRCHESITYTTHADFSFLDNLVPLLERWRGPISIAVYAPGTDFALTLESIAFIRDCTTSLVKEYVTFHVYFNTQHAPKHVPKRDSVFQEPYNCSQPAPYFRIKRDKTYRTRKKLLYPINIGRNVARQMASTHFVLASDIELYPSPNLIENFLYMIAMNKEPQLSENPSVFVLHVFEVMENKHVPENKTILRKMHRNGDALLFHEEVCSQCHAVPKSEEWINAKETTGLHIFHVGKRTEDYIFWEPFFIGTHADPLFDERLTWEGKSNKMPQAYALCVMDYNFLILDNAFLVHKPGVKVYTTNPRQDYLVAKTIQLIRDVILPELLVIYGVNRACVL